MWGENEGRKACALRGKPLPQRDSGLRLCEPSGNFASQAKPIGKLCFASFANWPSYEVSGGSEKSPPNMMHLRFVDRQSTFHRILSRFPGFAREPIHADLRSLKPN